MAYDISFILTFTDECEGVRSLDYDSLAEAWRVMRLCNRPSFIREVGYDFFTRTWIDRIRVTMA